MSDQELNNIDKEKENIMPDCYVCSPTCDNCRPKMVTCSKCGMMTLMDLPVCPRCKEPITEEDRNRAWEEWRSVHGAES